MNLTKDQKKQKSQDLASEITTTGTLFFTSYQGLKFVDMAELRATLALPFPPFAHLSCK